MHRAATAPRRAGAAQAACGVLLALGVGLGLAPGGANARIIGAEDREALPADACRSLDFTLATLAIRNGDGLRMSTATAMRLDGSDAFFVTTAHSLYAEGALRAPLEEVEVELLLPGPGDACEFRAARITRLAAGDTAPLETFRGAARDQMVFEVEGSGIDAREIRAVELTRRATCVDDRVRTFGFAWTVEIGPAPYAGSCRLRSRPEESAYPDVVFQHHDCDTGGGSAGALLFCRTLEGAQAPVALHAAGWGRDGARFGEGAYNVGTPLDPRTIALLHRAMTERGD